MYASSWNEKSKLEEGSAHESKIELLLLLHQFQNLKERKSLEEKKQANVSKIVASKKIAWNPPHDNNIARWFGNFSQNWNAVGTKR